MTRLEEYRGYLTIVLLNLAALGLIVWQLRDPRVAAVRIEPAPTRTPAPAPTAVRIRVHVSGAVASPDVVELAERARAVDAIAAAGGFTADADRTSVNLAQPLADGQQLHVPATGEPPRVSGARQAAGLSAGAAQGPGPASSAAGGGSAPGFAGSSDAPVNVNRASASELEALPGIGPALAERIVAHRQASGAFESPDDLLQVSGIGAKTLARFRDRVVVR